MSTTVQLTGGAYQDIQGNPLANGYLIMQLSQDASVASPASQIASGYTVKIQLDGNGNVITSPAQYVWPNDVLSPANTFYIVSAYTATGELVWGPNSQQVFSTPSPYPIGGWTPAQVNISTAPVVTYDIGVFFPGQSVGNQVLLLLPVERQVRFAVNLAPSVAACGTNPTAQAVFTLKQNGTQFATLTFATSGAASFVSSGATFNPGDVLTIVAPASTDATLANVGITLSGVATSNNT